MADVPQLPAGEESTRMAFVSNALAIVGFIILFIIIIWGLFHIINLTGGSFGSIFSSSPKVTVTAPKGAASDEPITISWTYSGTEAGGFSFLYPCKDNVSLATGDRNSRVTIPCGSAINVGSSTKATLMPHLIGGTPTDIPISVVFAQKSGKRIEGSATITISPAGTAMPGTTSTSTGSTGTTGGTNIGGTNTGRPTTPTPKPATGGYRSTTGTHKAANLVAHAASGPADLAVRVIAVGVVNPQTGILTPVRPTSPYNVVGIQFDIANVGGTRTPAGWTFSAVLPTGPQGYLYNSPAQISLAPGEHIVSTLRFSPSVLGGTIIINVDSRMQVYDANRGNNTVSQAI